MKILTWPNEILLKKSDKVDDMSCVQEVLDDMIQTMSDSNGIGLAAPQVGISQRFFVLDEKQLSEIDERESDQDVLVMINPEIVDEGVESAESYQQNKVASLEQVRKQFADKNLG